MKYLLLICLTLSLSSCFGSSTDVREMTPQDEYYLGRSVMANILKNQTVGFRTWTQQTVLLLLCTFVLTGCSWFAWLPWVEAPAKETDLTKPTELVDFDRELDISRQWKATERSVRLEPRRWPEGR